MNNLLQGHQSINVFNNGDENQKIHENDTEFEQKANNNKIEDNVDEIKQVNETVREIELKSFEMRKKVLKMEILVMKTFFYKQLIEHDEDILNKIQSIEAYSDNVHTTLDVSIVNNSKNNLIKAEILSNELMRKIKNAIKKKALNKVIISDPIDDIEVPDYRSIVTVKGTKGDVTNCITKANEAFNDGRYDKAERLLLKAERMIPTKNARELLNQVRAAKERNQQIKYTEKATVAEEPVSTFKEVEHIIREDNRDSAMKCLRAFEEAFSSHNFPKAERMLDKAKRLDPSLNLDDKLTQVKAAITKIENEKKKEMALQIEINKKQRNEPVENVTKNRGNYEELVMKKTFTDQKDRAISERFKIDYHHIYNSYTDIKNKEYPTKKNKEHRSSGLMANKANHEERDKETTSAVNTGEQFPAHRVIEHQNNISDIPRPGDSRVFLNNYESRTKYNDSHNIHTSNKKDNDFKKLVDEVTTKDGLVQDKSCVSIAMRKKLKSDIYMEQRKIGELFLNYALKAMRNRTFNMARQYLEYGLKILPNKDTRELLVEVRTLIAFRKGHHSLSQSGIKLLSFRILLKAYNFLQMGDLDKAEFLLIISWDINANYDTLLVYKILFKRRYDHFGRTDNKHEDNFRISDKVFEPRRFETYRLTDRLNNYEDFKQAENSQLRASEVYPSDNKNNSIWMRLGGVIMNILYTILMRKRTY